VAATAELVQAGATPSVGEIADAADVSRRTVYTYFPTLGHDEAVHEHDRAGPGLVRGGGAAFGVDVVHCSPSWVVVAQV
jgi:hypothetical protein